MNNKLRYPIVHHPLNGLVPVIVKELGPKEEAPEVGGFCHVVPLLGEYDILDDAPFDSAGSYWNVAVALTKPALAVTSQYFVM